MSIFLTDNITNPAGTILKDLGFFLQFIQSEKLEITGNKGLLPNHCILPLNAGMSHALQLQLKREQQRSYPHISALYLLTRTLGLLHITQEKSKRYLAVNDVALTKWVKLNLTEQYFNLMQAWLFRSNGELIDHGRSPLYGMFTDALMFLHDRLLSPLELKNKNANDQSWQLYRIKLYNLAMLEMFGMLKIEDAHGATDKSWLISTISITAFGKKWVTWVGNHHDFIFNINMDYPEEGSEKFYKKLKPVFPEWTILWKQEKKITDSGAHVFKVSLTKKIWRRLRIQGTESLDVLACRILDAFNFDREHLYRFTYIDRYGAQQAIYHPYADDDVCADEVNVGDLDILPGDSIEFLYDYGDSWTFNVQLENIDSKAVVRTSVIEEAGESPDQYPDYEDDDYEAGDED